MLGASAMGLFKIDVGVHFLALSRLANGLGFSCESPARVVD